MASYLIVRQTRLADSLDRAKVQARFDLLLAQGFVPLDPNPSNLLNAFQQAGANVVLIAAGTSFPSNPSVAPPIPAAIRSLVATGQLAYQRLDRGARHLLLVGGRIPGSADQLYLIVDESRIAHDFVQLRNALLVGWVVVVLLAGLIGRALARQTLGPVARASEAARSIAEGLMATRLPVEGTDEFGGWAASFNEMADALESKIAALSEAQARERRFTSDVAHELRTPLTALVGEASLLRAHLDRMPEDARRPAELLIQDVSRLRRLVEELMEISRFDAGRETVQAEPVELASLARSVIRSHGWDATVAQDGPALDLVTDRRRLERILANLIGNAVEHGRTGVRVRVAHADGCALIEVADKGPGILPEHVPHIFERFYKADPSRSGTGSGLGLAIAGENARLLGGDIEVWSERGLGTRFTVRLPVAGPLHDGEATVDGEHHDERRHPDERGK